MVELKWTIVLCPPNGKFFEFTIVLCPKIDLFFNLQVCYVQINESMSKIESHEQSYTTP